MKNFIYLLIFIFVVSCSSTRTTGITTQNKNSEISSDTNVKLVINENHNGSSIEKAIIIKNANEITGVKSEYEYIRINYPGAKIQAQSCLHKNGKIYDVLKFITAENTEREIYFDITDFYDKF